ncbi:MAG TPA: hypothetical protein VIY73_15075 [Polyangiaceae bacterium]
MAYRVTHPSRDARVLVFVAAAFALAGCGSNSGSKSDAGVGAGTCGGGGACPAVCAPIENVTDCPSGQTEIECGDPNLDPETLDPCLTCTTVADAGSPLFCCSQADAG